MTARSRLLLAALVPILGGCAFGAPPSAANRASQATMAACRERAEDVYVRQNRDLIYENDNSSTPYSAGPSTGLPMHGLSSQFAHQQVIDDCVRNTGTQTQRNDGTAAAAPASPAPAP